MKNEKIKEITSKAIEQLTTALNEGMLTIGTSSTPNRCFLRFRSTLSIVRT